MKYEPSGKTWHPNQPGAPFGRKIINIPPGHAKTTSISINYVTWLIHKNPNLKIIVVCKDQTLAMDILSAVKFRLTSPVYRDMHLKFAPEGGWKDPDNSWSATRIRVQGKDDGEKDPTFQALGIGGRIYGARSDIIILDDAITLANVNEYERHEKWLAQEVESRLDGGGLLALLGTRISPIDLYSQSRDLEDWRAEKVYDYFSMPALLEEGEGGVEGWKTLWPERFPPDRLSSARRDENMWALVYQQQDVAEDASFNIKAIQASINMNRFPGPMTARGVGHREGGMTGLYVVGGLDPAVDGCTAMVVSAVDPVTEKRYILDGFNQRNCSPQMMRDRVKYFTELYKINEWVIERNAFQGFLTQDEDLNQFLRSRGCRLRPHYTTENKYDADFGIASIAQLFLTCGEPPSGNRGGSWIKTPEKALMELPNGKQNAWVPELINQLVVWQPKGMKKRQKTDLVMAFWFTEIAIKDVVERGRKQITHFHTAFMSKSARSQQKVISISSLLDEQRRQTG
jgi:hypothetical protein